MSSSGRVVLQNAKGQPIVPAVVHDREDAEGAVVEFVDGQVAREVGQAPVEVAGQDAVTFFSQPPRPSSGWWHKGRRRGDRATGANWPFGRASHLR